MTKKTIFFFLLVYTFLGFPLQAATYKLTNDSIDVIIPCIYKDKNTLNLCIEGIRKNCQQIGRVIVISPECYTDQAEWFDEKQFSFSKQDITYYLAKQNTEKAQSASIQRRAGWYFQQLLKLYASYVIPDLSPNILLLDSDTVFLHPITFLTPSGNGIYNVGQEWHKPYFSHMDRLLPGLKRVYNPHSGICHHMLFQRPILEDLFHAVESQHGMDLWKAFCLQVNLDEFESGASEYEIYFNFAFSHTNQLQIRPLKWAESSAFYETKDKYQQEGYAYVSYHDWMKDSGRPPVLHIPTEHGVQIYH